jgi:hypothetical protein
MVCFDKAVLKLKKNELTILEMIYATAEDIDSLMKGLKDFPCLLMNYRSRIVKSSDTTDVFLPEEELTEKEVRLFVTAFKGEFKKIKKSSDTYEVTVKDKMGGIRKRIIPSNKPVLIHKPHHVIAPIKNATPVFLPVK